MKKYCKCAEFQHRRRLLRPFPSRSKLEETKLAQKLREKPNGVNIVGLAIGEKVKEEELLTKVCRTVTWNFGYFLRRKHLRFLE